MGEVVNLNRARKQKDRQRREEQAAANRAKFGRTKAEKQADRAAEAKRNRELEGHKLDD